MKAPVITRRAGPGLGRESSGLGQSRRHVAKRGSWRPPRLGHQAVELRTAIAIDPLAPAILVDPSEVEVGGDDYVGRGVGDFTEEIAPRADDAAPAVKAGLDVADPLDAGPVAGYGVHDVLGRAG